MITSPAVSVPRHSSNPAWESRPASGERGAPSPVGRPYAHRSFAADAVFSPADPHRQAGRLPIKLLKMLTARAGHIMHPEYLQPLPSTPISPIELDAKKSPLALLAQTCSQIGKPDPPASSKLSSVASGGDKDGKAGPLKISDIGADDKSSFKPYAKSSSSDSKKESSPNGDKNGFRVPSATCPPFTPRTGSPGASASPGPGPSPGSGSSSSSASDSPLPCEGKAATDKEDKKECGERNTNAASPESNGGHRTSGISPDRTQESTPGSKALTSDSSVLGSGLVAPVSPYKPGHAVFPLPPAGISYPGSLAGAYAGYPQPFLPPGMSLEHAKSGGQLLSAQFAACSKAGTSPLAAASPPSLMSASLCRDPYCLSYHCSGHLTAAAAASGANCAHDAASALKSGYPLVYSAHPLHGVPSSAPTFGGHPLYPYGFVLPNDPLPHVCNWVSANGACDKRFSSSEELLGHLRTHTAFATGSEKLLAGYPGSSSSLAAAAAMACHMHVPSGGSPATPGALSLRGPHHPLGLGSRYHPYSKSPLPAPGAPVPVPVPAAAGTYYSPYALYGQRLTTASALGYQ
ncbi:zinc finger protein 503-like [Syngnathoides biaculeatus]|uniref:zinc finger protein 503-like n=1 Tax=Syngnathoides biaculeatus TaxID=300417 RepID=UPI002ADD70C1|nr:zinc finger protein 503-like [Syngnathoides biaculeatus]